MWRGRLLASGVSAEKFQCHHLIPAEIVYSSCFDSFFGRLRQLGFRPHDFDTNGIALPCTERAAFANGLPLHRGPHPRYTEIVSHRVATIEADYRKSCGAMEEPLQRIYWLQNGLRKALERNKLAPLNRRDPMSPHVSFENIERNMVQVEDLVSYIEEFDTR
jgi:hypothetical protein